VVRPPCPKEVDQSDGDIAAPMLQVFLNRSDLLKVRIMLESMFLVLWVVDCTEKPLFPPQVRQYVRVELLHYGGYPFHRVTVKRVLFHLLQKI
jgi:hypothetical protein